MEQAKTKESKEIKIEDEDFTVIIKFFGIRTSKPDEFVDKLEELCREYCIQNDFSFKYSVEG